MTAGVVPSSRAARAAAIASAWIAASPNLLAVLDWHATLCPACAAGDRCAERREIVEEYGAGEFGATVFFPDCAAMDE